MTPWHTDDALMEAYVSGRLDAARAASVEQHLEGCGRCRSSAMPHADEAVLARAWSDTLDELDRPRTRMFERIVLALGLPAPAARLAAGASAARGAWLLSCVLISGFALIARDFDPRSAFGFLTLAPLLPLTGVAVAYGRGPFPMYDVIAATAYPRLRLVLLRCLPIVPMTILFLLIARLVLPRTEIAAAWLLPGLALAAVTLALERFVPAGAVVTVLSLGWLAFVIAVRYDTGSINAAFSPAVQLLSLVIVLAAALGTLGTRRLS
jgi:hypothetical protein